VETPEGSLLPRAVFLVHLFRASGEEQPGSPNPSSSPCPSPSGLVLPIPCSPPPQTRRGGGRGAAVCNQMCPAAGGVISVGSLPVLWWCSCEMLFLRRDVGFFMVPCFEEEQLYWFAIRHRLLLILPSEAWVVRSSQGSLM